jgi:hypothetical protein
MVLAIVIDGQGRSICTEMLPGNTADATVLLPVVDRLRERFHVGRVCVVADRGIISAATLEADIAAFIQTHNADPKPLVWTKSADAILQTIARYCSDTLAIHAPTC